MGDEQRLGYEEMLAQSRAGFESVPDFTVAVEEEFALLDPDSLDLVNRFEELLAADSGGLLLVTHAPSAAASTAQPARANRCAERTASASRNRCKVSV